jgi:WD40 repeat protein
VKRAVEFALALFAGFAVSAMAQPHPGSPQMIRAQAPVTAVALSAISNRAVIVSRDKKLTLWDLEGSRLLETIALTTADIDVAAISDDGRWIFTGDHSGNMYVWDAGTGRAQVQVRMHHYPGAVSFSHDSKFIAIAPMGDPVQVFDVAASKLLYETKAVTGGTAALAFSRDGGSIATADADTAVRVYDAHSGKLVAENRDFLLEPLAVDFTADGRQVVAGGGDKILMFIDAGSGKLIRRLPKTEEPVAFSCLKVSPDGSVVAVIFMKAENMTQAAPVVMWEVSSGKRKSQWLPDKLALWMDWTRDGRLISVGFDADSMVVWRVP